MRYTVTLYCLFWLMLAARFARGQEAGKDIEFIENQGQWPKPARYAAQLAPGARLFVEETGLRYALVAGLPSHGPEAASPRGPLRAHSLRVEFVQPGPASHLTAAAGSAAASQRHYLRGADPARWAANVPAWHQLRYQQLWPGIDMVLRESDTQQLEYDLLLAAWADPALAQLRYHGADGLRLDPATGNLLVTTSAGLLTEYRPRAWQTDPTNGERRPVSCAFALAGTTVGFRLGAYDRRWPLVIDPTVQFSSYTGSAVENWGFAATHDATGNLYTAGVVFEPGYPTTTGAYQTTFGGNIDVAVMKFNANSTGPAARAWATYLGGSALEFPHSLLVNGRGELLLLGTTSSPNYPTTTTALSRVLKGGPTISPFGGNSPFVLTGGADLVLTRLSASGGQLRASTYLGGTGTDGLLDANAPAPRLRHNYGDAFRGDLALDPQGNVYVASVTSSTNFPGAGAAYRGGPSDGLVTSLDSSFSQVRWTTLLGGTGADAAYSLQREDGGGLLVAGGTTSPNLAGAANGYRAALGGGVDGFVARLGAGGTLAQSTYLGTSGYDQAFFVRTGPTGQAYVLGQTLGPRWPGLDTTRYYRANGQQFIQQLAPDLRSAGFATVFGTGRSTTDISPTAFGLDCYGRLALAGWGGGLDPNGGNTVGLPVTSNALQANTDGQDFYLMQLSDGAHALDYASFFGTSADDHVDGGTSRFDSQLTLYQAVCACDQGRAITLPIPPGAYTYTGTNGAARCNNAAFKLAFPAGALAGDTLSVCAFAQPLALGGSPAGGTWAGPGVSGSVAAGYVFTPSTLLVGTQVLTYTSPATAAGCTGTTTRRIVVLAQLQASLAAPTQQFCLMPGVTSAPVPLTGSPAGGVYSGRGVVNTATGAVFDPVLAGAGVHTLWYSVSGGRCPALVPVVMVVERVIKPEVGPLKEVCANDPPLPLVGTPAGGIWTGAGVTSLGSAGYYFTPSAALVGGPYLLTYTLPPGLVCNAASDTLLVRVLPPGVQATVPADTSFCLSGRPYRLRGGLPVGGSWSGPGVAGSLATGFFFTPTPQLVGTTALLYTGPPNTSTPLCPGRAYRAVTVVAGGTAQLATTPIVCAVASPQPLQATPTGGTWNGPGVSGSVAAGFVFTPSPALVGTQTLGYTGPLPANAAQCPAAGTIQVEVLAVPAVQIDPVGPINFCLTAPPHGVVLTATPLGGVFSGPGVVANRFNPAAVGPGRYPITYTWSYPSFGLNCPITTTRTVEVNLVPVPVPIDTLLCTSGTVQLRSRPAGGVWSGPGVAAGGLLTVPTTPGTFEVRYTLPDGCAPQLYRITVPAENSTIARWSAPLCATNHLAPYLVRFEATGSRASQVRWDFGDGGTATGAVVEHAYQAPGPHQPTASLPGLAGAPGPCTDELTLPPLTVEAAAVPNIITPNGDQLNDTFRPRIGGCGGRLQVFSRWGQQVFDTPDYRGDWDGAGLPVGLYYFLLDGGHAAVRVKGWVEIVR